MQILVMCRGLWWGYDVCTPLAPCFAKAYDARWGVQIVDCVARCRVGLYTGGARIAWHCLASVEPLAVMV